MESSNSTPPQIDAQPSANNGDWRSQLLPDSRQRIVNKIANTLKRHLSYSNREGLQELEHIAVRFEELIFNVATSQSDYLKKISLKMMSMDAKSLNTGNNSLPSISAGTSRNLQNSGNKRTRKGKHIIPNHRVTPHQTVAQLLLDYGDWRSQLLPDSRERIVNKIMETFKRFLTYSGQEGLQELKRIAVEFEENIYSDATSQSDYLRKISFNMLAIERTSQEGVVADCL